MKVSGIFGTAVLSLLLGIAAPGHSQQEQQGNKRDHPEQQQSRHELAKPDQQHANQQVHSTKPQAQHAQQQSRRRQSRSQNTAQQRQLDQNQRQQQHARQQVRPNQNYKERVQQSAWQQHRAGSWQSDHRTWQQRGGYNGYRIPEYQYRGYFGPEHGFRLYGRPFLVVGGYPRFQYSSYWFSLVDPWPEYWANNWYDTDDVYVSYVDNGYYLFNRMYPTAGIAISISR